MSTDRFVRVQPTPLGVGDGMGTCTTMGLPGAHSQQGRWPRALGQWDSFSESRISTVRMSGQKGTNVLLTSLSSHWERFGNR